MSHLARHIRRLLAVALYYSGLLWIYAGFRLRGKAVVLMYHRVLPESADSFSHPGIIVRPSTFENQIKFLKRHFHILTPTQFENGLTRSGFARRSCLITFDDGWSDNLEYALPTLKKYQVPAVVFVATAHVGSSNPFWQERLRRLLFAASRSPDDGHDVLHDLDISLACSMSDKEAQRIIGDAVTKLKSRPLMVIERLLQRLEATTGLLNVAAFAGEDDRFLTWIEVGILAASGLVTIGSHAHTHTPLTSLGYTAAKVELARSRQDLSVHGISAVRICAYPNGDVDEATARAAHDAGFTLGFTTAHGSARQGDDPFRLRRVNIHESSARTRPEFLCMILGVL